MPGLHSPGDSTRWDWEGYIRLVSHALNLFLSHLVPLMPGLHSRRNSTRSERECREYIRFVCCQLRTICEKSVRSEKHARCEKLARKKGAHEITQKLTTHDEITQKLTTHVSQFDHFLVQFNFIPYRTRESLCFVHNYKFYHKMVRDARNEKFVLWSSIHNTK